MEPIGYVPVQLIPSLDGWSDAVDRQLGGQLKVSGKKGGKALAKGVGEGLKDLEREVDSAGKAYGKLRDKAEDALGKVRTEEEKLKKLRESGASNDRIVAGEERLAKARRDSARATRDAEDSHTGLLSAQKRLGDGTNDLGGRFGKLGDLAGRLGSSIGALGVAGVAGAAVAGIAAVGAIAVKTTSELYDLGAEFDDMSDNIRVKTGASGAVLDGLTKSVQSIATSTPSSIGAIGDVVAETTRALHLTGPELEDVSKNIANLNRLTGEDTDVKALGQAFRGFGIDAKGQVPALNSLFQTYQKTGIGVNELLASVVKGGPQLREFGFDLGSSAGLLSEFEEAGLDGDKALSALTKGLAQFAKDGKDPKQALSGTVDEVQRLIAAGKDPAAQDLTNKIFGAKAGLQIFEGIKSGALDIQQLQDTITGTGDTIQTASDDTADWAEQWQTLKNKAMVALQPLASATFDGINGGLSKLSDWVTDNPDKIIEGFGGIAEGVLKTGAAIGQFVAGAVHVLAFFQEVTGRTVGGVADALGGLLNGVGALVGIFDEDMGKSIDDAGNKLHHFADISYASAGSLNKLATEISDGADGLWQFGSDVGAAADKAAAAAKPIGQLGDSVRDLMNIPIKPIDVQVNATPGTGVILQGGNMIIPILTGAQAPPGPPSTAVPGDPGSVILPVPARATGGIFDVWDSVASFATGKLPRQALIQPPMGAGLVQWAEKSTGGEAFIPLNGGDRSKAIWAETGRRLFSFDQGGFYGAPDVLAAQALAGTPYSKGNRADCSGMASRVIARALGLPESGLMTTKNAKQWLAQAGFRPGIGGPGQISVGWYDHGPGQNDGHMAMTLSDGTHAEAGGENGVFTLGAGAAGADSPQFDQHMFLPTLFGEGQPGSLGNYSSASGAGVAGIGPNGESGTYAAPDAKAVREANEKVADADQRVREAEAKKRELDADAKESQKISAQADVDKATREAADARADLAEVQKGKFTADKDKSGSDSSGGFSISLPSAFSGLAGIGLSGLGLKTKVSPDSPERTFAFGDAAAAAVGGQLGSALDVFGVGDSPPWLQAASKFISGIKIGDGPGSSAAPIAAAISGTGTPPPDDAEGGLRAGRAAVGGVPGPVYNIRTATVEDAFLAARRKENERAAAKVSVY